MTTTVLAVIAAAQMVFFLGVLLLLVGYRWRDARFVPRRLAERKRLSLVLSSELSGVAEQGTFQRELHRYKGAAVASVLHQYAAQIGGEPWERLVATVRGTGWFDSYVRSRVRSRFWWRRLVAGRLLSILGTTEDSEDAELLVLDSHPAVKVGAIQVVKRIRDAALLTKVLDEAISAKPVVRRYLFDTLVSVPGPLTPTLADRFAQPEHATGELRALIDLAGELSAIELLDHLLDRMEHSEIEIRIAVARALGGYPHPRAEAALVRLLGDGEWPVRTQAASSLGSIRAVSAVPHLEEALGDRNWWVRLRAAIALRQIGPGGLATLRSVLEGSDRFASEMASYILGLTDEAVSDYLV